MNRRAWGWYLAANALLALILFRGALWGTRLLAPLDVAPALLSKYRWLDPGSTGVPANHYTIDQLTYDLPLQRTIHQAYRRGEVPWWDPYTFAGRPLLADAHINGTDPVRVACYRALPFEAAYNWTLILHWFLSGAGVFVLLRHFGVRDLVAGGLALAFQCSGYAALFFGHPWNLGAFLYYPWLWLAWDGWLTRRTWWSWPVAGLAMAGVFYAGNLQSHAYVVIFAIVLIAGHGGRSLAGWLRALPIIAASGLLGAALAAPVLLAQVEFYRLSVRAVPVPMDPRLWLGGLASGTAVFPWLLGTFRTLDLSKLTGPFQTALGFVLFIGSPAVVLAAIGAWRGRTVAPRPEVHRCAVLLVAAYLLILSTPLQSALYTRSGGLGLLGLVVLAALGVEYVWRSGQPFRKWGLGTATFTLALVLALNVAAFVIYPRVLPRVEQYMKARSEKRGSLGAAPALDAFQVRNLPNEISLRNPETAAATGGLLLLSLFLLRPAWRERPWALPALLALNLAPAAQFYARFVPNQPLAAWERLQAGGPPQLDAAARLRGSACRLHDVAPSRYDQVFPNCLGHLHAVRTLHGYSALVPHTLDNLPPAQQAEWRDVLGNVTVVSSAGRELPDSIETNQLAAPVSFRWQGDSPRTFTVEVASLNTQRVRFEPGPAGTLLWTDTAYPGWEAVLEGQRLPIEALPPTFSRMHIPAGGAFTLELRYRPSGLVLGQRLSLGGALLLVAISAAGWGQSRRNRVTAGR